MSKRTRGQGLVEFALILPLLLLLMMGIVEFGYVFIVYTSVFNAAREGARHGIVHGLDEPGIRARTEQMLLLVDHNEVDITISYDSGPQTDAVDVNDVAIGHRVRVEVVHDLPTLTPLIHPFAPSFRIESRAARTILSLRSPSSLLGGGHIAAGPELGGGPGRRAVGVWG